MGWQSGGVLRKILPFTGAAVAGCAALGSVASRAVDTPWYAELDRPSFQPPRQVFPVVWTTLYADIGATSAVALDRLGDDDPGGASRYRRALAVNLVLNTSWSWVFFHFHRLGAATVVAGALAASSIDLVRRTASAAPAAGAALAPYAVWCSFATVLSGAIWRRNRRPVS
jgi:translocator protein